MSHIGCTCDNVHFVELRMLMKIRTYTFGSGWAGMMCQILAFVTCQDDVSVSGFCNGNYEIIILITYVITYCSSSLLLSIGAI